jgi:gamma-glutamylcyclotransferase (GGCT)/AIG2-like uncharacterized protein YtfP
MSPAPTLLFAYGTLMRGFALHRLLQRSRHVGDGTVAGRLVDLGAYPGALPDAHARIAGEVYAIDDAVTWSALDSAEGPQYHRGVIDVRMRDGAERIACIYWYRGPLRGVPIPGGDYRAHAPACSIHHDRGSSQRPA